MRLKLSDWLSIRWGTEQCMDVITQLLSIPHEEIGKCLDPAAFYLEFPEDDPSFGELKQERLGDAFDPEYKPVQVLDSEADDVFVIGLMLYRLLTGRQPELGMARFLMVKVHDKQRVPLLHVPQSSLNPLVEQMTDLNPETRITRRDALKQVAELWKGSALISVTEAATGAVLDTIEVPLTGSTTRWRSPYRMHYGDMLLVPCDCTEIKIPMRVCTKSYPLLVAAQREAPPSCFGQMLQKPGFALDIGAESLRLICLGGKACREDTLIVPTVMALRSRGDFVFGDEAKELIADGKAGRVSCTSTDEQQEEHVLAADGSSVQITAGEAAEALLGYLHREAVRMGMPAQEMITVTCPAGWDTVRRTFWLHAAQNADFRTVAVYAPLAVLLCHSLYETVRGNVMIVDAGSDSIDVCVLKCGHGCSPEKVAELADAVRQSFSAPGGAEMTELLVRDMLHTVDLKHGLSLYSCEASGMNAVQFAHDREMIREAAERIKRTLSFKLQAEAELMIHDGSANPLKVSFCYTRSELSALLESVSQGLRQALQQARAASGVPREQIGTVVLTGGASLSPIVREAVARFFNKTECRVVYRDQGYTALRGAAFFTTLCGVDVKSEVVSDLLYDLGIITADSIRQLPEFRVLLPAGTAVPDDAECTFMLTVSEADLDRNENCQLRVYSRPVGMEHVRNTLDPEGDCIRIMGKLTFPLPDDFRLMEDKLEIHLVYQPDETIAAEARICRKKKFNLFGMAKNSKDSEGFSPAKYVPVTT